VRMKVLINSHLFYLCSLIFFSLVLTACGSKVYFPDLETYVEEVQAKPKGRIRALPDFKAHGTYAYSSAAMRSPFDPPIVIRESTVDFDPNSVVVPDLTRTKEYLEQFSFDALRMVGTIQRPDEDGSQLWALLKDSQGGIHRVKIGDYLGRSHGQIINVFPNIINVMEIVPSGEVDLDGNKLWIERPRNLVLKTD